MNHERKMKIDDIKILSAGEQIKSKIINSGRTIEGFAEEIDLYSVSVKQYLRRNDGGSATFKIKMMNALNLSYDEIVKNPVDQLRDINQLVSNEIYKYKEASDIMFLQKLKEKLEEYNADVDVAWAERNIGMNRFYIGEAEDAIRLLKRSVSTSEKHNDQYGRVVFLSDLGLVHYYMYDFIKARSCFAKALGLMETFKNLDEKIKFIIHFRTGMAYNQLGDPEEAKKYYTMALEYAENDTFIGLAMMNIGVSEIKLGRALEAKLNFKGALKEFDGDHLRQSFVYNNYAQLYLMENDLERAMIFVEKAMESCKAEDVLYSFHYFEVFAQIKIAYGEKKTMLKKLLELVETGSRRFVFRDKIITALKTLIQNIDESEMDMVGEIEEVLLKLIEKTNESNEGLMKELKAMLGDLFLKSYKYKQKRMHEQIGEVI